MADEEPEIDRADTEETASESETDVLRRQLKEANEMMARMQEQMAAMSSSTPFRRGLSRAEKLHEQTQLTRYECSNLLTPRQQITGSWWRSATS